MKNIPSINILKKRKKKKKKDEEALWSDIPDFLHLPKLFYRAKYRDFVEIEAWKMRESLRFW